MKLVHSKLRPRHKRSKRASMLALSAACTLIVTSCVESDSDVPKTTEPVAGTSSASESTAVNPSTPSTVEPTTTSTTTPAPLAVFDTPSAAGQALFGAWTQSDRGAAGALNLAAPGELDKLFFTPPLPSAKNRGCDSGEFGVASCFFGNDQGGVNITLVPAPGGWSVDLIDPFA